MYILDELGMRVLIKIILRYVKGFQFFSVWKSLMILKGSSNWGFTTLWRHLAYSGCSKVIVLSFYPVGTLLRKEKNRKSTSAGLPRLFVYTTVIKITRYAWWLSTSFCLWAVNDLVGCSCRASGSGNLCLLNFQLPINCARSNCVKIKVNSPPLFLSLPLPHHKKNLGLRLAEKVDWNIRDSFCFFVVLLCLF